MLRIVIALALVFAVVWYMLRDGGEQKVAIEHVKDIDAAQEAVKAQEQMAAQMASQTDAIRDQAMGAQPAPTEEPAP